MVDQFKQCKGCGKSNELDAKECISCNKDLSDSIIKEIKDKKNSKWMTIFKVLLFLILVGGFLIYQVILASNKRLDDFKKANSQYCSQVTHEEMITGLFANSIWETGEAPDGTQVFNIIGDLMVEGSPRKGIIQFKLNNDKSTYSYKALEFNGAPQGKAMAGDVLYEMCKLAQDKIKIEDEQRLREEEKRPSEDTRVLYLNLKKYLQNKDKASIAKIIDYPFTVSGIGTIVSNETDFISHYEQIFDKKLIDIILNSTEKDLSKMGYRGTMLHNGILWLRDKKIIGINYISTKTKVLVQEKENLDREFIHLSLKKFKQKKLVFVTSKFKIRIDKLENSGYRYSTWEKQKKQNEKPNLILRNGTREFLGSGGDHEYTFKNGKYTYVIYISVIGGEDPNFIGNLKVYKNGKEILSEDIIKIFD